MKERDLRDKISFFQRMLNDRKFQKQVELIVSLFASRSDNVGLHYPFITYVSTQADAQNRH